MRYCKSWNNFNTPMWILSALYKISIGDQARMLELNQSQKDTLRQFDELYNVSFNMKNYRNELNISTAAIPLYIISYLSLIRRQGHSQTGTHNYHHLWFFLAHFSGAMLGGRRIYYINVQETASSLIYPLLCRRQICMLEILYSVTLVFSRFKFYSFCFFYLLKIYKTVI